MSTRCTRDLIFRVLPECVSQVLIVARLQKTSSTSTVLCCECQLFTLERLAKMESNHVEFKC